LSLGNKTQTWTKQSSFLAKWKQLSSENSFDQNVREGDDITFKFVRAMYDQKVETTLFTLGCRGQYYKTFYGRNLRISVISWSVCPWQASPA